MKINGEKYADENQLTTELEKLKSGSIDEIQLVRSVKENTYMRLVANTDSYDFCFVKGEDVNSIVLDKTEFDNIASALLSYCNKDGKYKKMFHWQKSSENASPDEQPLAQESHSSTPEQPDNSLNEEPVKVLSPFECFTNTLTKNYCNFSGRASRRTFWCYTLFIFLLLLIIFGGAAITGSSLGSLTTLYFIISIALFLPGLSITVRRLHDTNKSGWYFLMGFIPYVGGIILLIFTLQAGTPGENKYGAPVP